MARDDDEFGNPPKDINPDAVLSGDALDEIGSDVAGTVEKPSYEVLPPSPSRPATPTRPPREDGQALAGTFSPDTTVPAYLQNTAKQLGVIQTWLHGRDLQKLQRSQVMKLTKELFDYQYKDMQHLLMLSMDVQKKRRFAQYLAATRTLQVEIQEQSAEAQLAIINTLFDNRKEAYITKNNRDRELTKDYEGGVISRKQYDASIQDNERYMDEHVLKLNETANTMILRHGEFLYKTLELFQTKLINGGHL